ncbi:P-loop NTPase [Candidatus Riflebacteria bacterium]
MEREILAVLRTIQDPDLHKDIVSLGFIKNLEIQNGDVSFDIELTTPACPVKEQFREEAIQKVSSVQGVKSVKINMTANVRSGFAKKAEHLDGVKNVIAIASGKGGVGKSTVAVNLALGLAKSGASVGLLDADIYGPSIAMMLNCESHPTATMSGALLPVEVFGIKVISMAMFTDENSPVIWRGPMVSGMIMQFLKQVDWGELDYLVVDLPPGTGDIQLTLTQQCPLSGALIVTTPQDVALIDAKKGLKMFEMVGVPVMGIVENMSSFICDNCQKEHHIFSTGGGEKMRDQMGVPLLGKVPMMPKMVISGDLGQPLLLEEPNSPIAKVFYELSGRVASQLASWNSVLEDAMFDYQLTWATLPIKEASQTPDPGIPANPLPRDVFRLADDRLAVTWTDGVVSFFSLPFLRANCCCAQCINEWTGERIYQEGSSPEDLQPITINSVGRYAMNLGWSDGHNSGIYSYPGLRKLSQYNSNPNNSS